MLKGILLYVQLGGVIVVINVIVLVVISIVWVKGIKVLVVCNGIFGVLCEELIDILKEIVVVIVVLVYILGGVFGLCCYKLKLLEVDWVWYECLFEVLCVYDVCWFFYNGGNDLVDIVWKVFQLVKVFDYDLICIGVFKIIDNDLVVIDICFGFGLVVKYIVVLVCEVVLDVVVMVEIFIKVFVYEVMGCYVGWFVVVVGLVGEGFDDVLYIILLFECVYDEVVFLVKVKVVVECVGYCVVVVFEGIQIVDGCFVVDVGGGKDFFGYIQFGGVVLQLVGWVKDVLGYKVYWILFDYLQCLVCYIVFRIDWEQVQVVGKVVVQFVLKGQNVVMLVIVCSSDSFYCWKIEVVLLYKVVNYEKKMLVSFICRDGFGIIVKVCVYLLFLIRGEVFLFYGVDGLLKYVMLKNVVVWKKLVFWQEG